MKKLLLSAAFFLATTAHAAGIEVKNAWARATVPGLEVGAVYLDITSTTAAKLIKVESSVVPTAEIHTMTMQGNVMQMRKIDSLDLPAGNTVHLAPGGNHIMLIGLKKPLKEGDKVSVTLTVEKAPKVQEKVEVSAEVRSMTMGAGGTMHHH